MPYTRHKSYKHSAKRSHAFKKKGGGSRTKMRTFKKTTGPAVDPGYAASHLGIPDLSPAMLSAFAAGAGGRGGASSSLTASVTCRFKEAPIPPRYFCTFKYSVPVTLGWNDLGNGLIAPVPFAGNSIFRPGGTALQACNYFDLMSTLYSFYRVHASRIKVITQPTVAGAGAPDAQPAVVCLFPTIVNPSNWTSTEQYTPSSVAAWHTWANPCRFRSAGNIYDKPLSELSMAQMTKQCWGVTDLDDLGFVGNMNGLAAGGSGQPPSSPTNGWFWGVGLIGATQASTRAVVPECQVEIEYKVELFGPNWDATWTPSAPAPPAYADGDEADDFEQMSI